MTTANIVKVTAEEKAQIIKRMLPPGNESVPLISKETGIKENRLYNWRKKAKDELGMESSVRASDGKWSSQDKFMIVVETFGMNETELGEYCRTKGIFLSELKEWKTACLQANSVQPNSTPESNQSKKEIANELKEERRKQKELEQELRRKEKALAEMAALMVLRKKAQAIWGEHEEE